MLRVYRTEYTELELKLCGEMLDYLFITSDFWGSRKTLLHVGGHVLGRPAILCILFVYGINPCFEA